MSRYVEYDSLIADSYESDMWDRGTQRFNLRVVEVDDIENAPSLDLVTCAECRHKRLYDGETKYYYCALEDRPNRQWSVDDWNYCYWGERKENEQAKHEYESEVKSQHDYEPIEPFEWEKYMDNIKTEPQTDCAWGKSDD